MIHFYLYQSHIVQMGNTNSSRKNKNSKNEQRDKSFNFPTFFKVLIYSKLIILQITLSGSRSIRSIYLLAYQKSIS